MSESVWDYPRPPALTCCERHVRIGLGGVTIVDSSYRDPVARYAALRDHVAFYPGQMDACWLDDERVRSQEGDFYGGWITADIVGPFKGPAGTRGW